MTLDSGDFCVESSDPLSSLGHLDVKELLHRERETLLVGHWDIVQGQQKHNNDPSYQWKGRAGGKRCMARTSRAVIKSVKVRQGLGVGLVLDELFGSSMKKTNVTKGSRVNDGKHLLHANLDFFHI